MKKQALIFCLLCLPLFSFAQESGVFPLANNFLYRGVENPVKILAHDYSCDSLYVVSSILKFRPTYNCEYYVTPMNESYGIFTINALVKGDTIFIGRHEFRLLKTPDPIATVRGSRDGKISVGGLLRAFRVTAELIDFLYEVDFKIKSYTALIERRDSIIYKEDVTGEQFPSSLSASFQEIHRLDQVFFVNIIAVGPDEIEREIDPLSLTVK